MLKLSLLAVLTVVAFEEKFEAPLGDGWSWVREDPAAWKIEKGALRLNVLPGTLWKEKNTAKNILLRTLPENAKDADLAIEVTVTNEPQKPGEQVALMWYAGEDDYVKITKEFLGGKQVVVLAHEVAAKAEPVKIVPVEGRTLRLKLVKKGSTISGHYAPEDKDDWTMVAECEIVRSHDVHIALVAHGGAEGSGRVAELRKFRISEPAK